mmetsp:Transcript_24210/g.37282  ORF Transcript_24210/g.37282 Transcript_24210/m.37282 type:complete len:201 (-) Transcript_24210:1023-1625(-)
MVSLEILVFLLWAFGVFTLLLYVSLRGFGSGRLNIGPTNDSSEGGRTDDSAVLLGEVLVLHRLLQELVSRGDMFGKGARRPEVIRVLAHHQVFQIVGLYVEGAHLMLAEAPLNGLQSVLNAAKGINYLFSDARVHLDRSVVIRPGRLRSRGLRVGGQLVDGNRLWAKKPLLLGIKLHRLLNVVVPLILEMLESFFSLPGL